MVKMVMFKWCAYCTSVACIWHQSLINFRSCVPDWGFLYICPLINCSFVNKSTLCNFNGYSNNSLTWIVMTHCLLTLCSALCVSHLCRWIWWISQERLETVCCKLGPAISSVYIWPRLGWQLIAAFTHLSKLFRVTQCWLYCETLTSSCWIL